MRPSPACPPPLPSQQLGRGHFPGWAVAAPCPTGTHSPSVALELGEEVGGTEEACPLGEEASGSSFLCGSRLGAQPTSGQRSLSWGWFSGSGGQYGSHLGEGCLRVCVGQSRGRANTCMSESDWALESQAPLPPILQMRKPRPRKEKGGD